MLSKEGPWGFREMLAVGKLPGVIKWDKFGQSLVGTTWTTIFSATTGVPLYQYMDFPEKLKLASTDPDDAVGSTGCEYVTMRGMDSEGNRQEEIIELNGQTPVESLYIYSRINRIANISLHTHDLQGQLYAGPSSAVWVGGEPDHMLAHVFDGNNQTQMFVSSVPMGYKLLVFNTVVTCHDSEPTEVALFARQANFASQAACSVFAMKVNWLLVNDILVLADSGNPFILPEGIDFEVRGRTTTKSEQLAVNATGYLVPNIYFGDY